MTPYPKYTTTVIGAHSVPDWYEVLDRLVAVGQLSMASLVDAQYRASQAASLDQELAGIDVVTGGEMPPARAQSPFATECHAELPHALRIPLVARRDA
jgi:methionine synthase II (cobalamin-independent)